MSKTSSIALLVWRLAM